jgi:hypothetical protein
MGTSDYNRFRSAIPLFIAVKVPETFYYSYNPRDPSTLPI